MSDERELWAEMTRPQLLVVPAPDRDGALAAMRRSQPDLGRSQPDLGSGSLDPLQLWAGVDDDIVAVRGETDISNHEAFVAIIEAAVQQSDVGDERGNVHLDLAGMTFIDVGGVRALVRTYPADSGRFRTPTCTCG